LKALLASITSEQMPPTAPSAQIRMGRHRMQILRPGDRNDGVRQVRQILAGQGLLRNVDAATEDVFDSAVDLAVRAFQQHRGLTADGLVGHETFGALQAARWKLGDRLLSHNATQPMIGDDVAELQRQLLEIGYAPARADGRFGSSTAAALRSFQRDYGVFADGVCGPETLRSLRQLTGRVVGGRPQMLREMMVVADAGPNLLGKRIVIDPGHGGADRGATTTDSDLPGPVTEADITFDLATRLEGRLAAQGVTALLTRGRHTTSEDTERAQFANAQGADLVISLHVDHSTNPLANGVATFYYGGQSSSTIGERFADLVQREVVARTNMQDARIHPKSWTLLLQTAMPTIRLELGYLSSPVDLAKLVDSDFRDNVAEALSVAVQRLYLPREQDPPTGVLRLPALAT
jgi:N-acetylmuramoyl-L-alanine amidase